MHDSLSSLSYFTTYLLIYLPSCSCVGRCLPPLGFTLEKGGGSSLLSFILPFVLLPLSSLCPSGLGPLAAGHKFWHRHAAACLAPTWRCAQRHGTDLSCVSPCGMKESTQGKANAEMNSKESTSRIHISEQLPCRSAEVKIFSVFLCQRCREILVKFSVLRFPGFGCATEHFTKISRQKRFEKQKISCKFHSAGAQRCHIQKVIRKPEFLYLNFQLSRKIRNYVSVIGNNSVRLLCCLE